MKTTLTLMLAAAFVLATAPVGRAAELFQVQMSSPGLSPVTVGGSSLLDLIENAIEAEGAFARFDNVDRIGVLNYAGVNQAIRVTINAAATSATLEIPITGFRRTFSGASSEELRRQITDFLKADGLNQVARFLSEINARSPVALTDGTPHSSTALAASRAYDQFGTRVGQTREEKERFKKYSGRFNLSFAPAAGQIDAGGFKGYSASLPVTAKLKIVDRVGVVADFTPQYLEIEHARAAQLAFSLGVPVKIIQPSETNPWLWQLTPSASVVAAGSVDQLTGGLLGAGGLTSLLAYDWKYFTVSMGNHFSAYEGIKLKYNEYEFDSGISQRILKNGLRLSVPIGRRGLFEVHGAHTHFLERAAVQDYFTVGGDLAYRFLGKADAPQARRGYVFVGVYADFGKDYTAAHVRAGTGWKF